MYKMEVTVILKLVCYTLTAFTAVCAGKAQRARKVPVNMDDVFGMLLRGDEKATKGAYVPPAKNSSKSETGNNDFEEFFSGDKDKKLESGSASAATDSSQGDKKPDDSANSDSGVQEQSPEGEQTVSKAEGGVKEPTGDKNKEESGDQLIKPHDRVDKQLDNDEGQKSTHAVDGTSKKDEWSVLLPENTTEVGIKPASDGSGEDKSDILGSSDDPKAGSIDNVTLDDLIKSQTENQKHVPTHKEDKIIKPTDGLLDDVSEGDLLPESKEDLFPESNEDLDLSFNYKKEEKNHRKKREHKRAEYKRLSNHASPIPLEEGGRNAGLAAAIRYLGSGYDIVFGNPLGDPTIMVDPGYRNPVLSLDWTDEFHNHDGTNIKEPRGTWIRPELSCRQAESVDHVNTVEDYKKELSVDAQLSADIPFYFSFSASAGYKNFVKTVAANVTKSYILKTYCLRYVAGIHDLKNVDTTPAFKVDVLNLPDVWDIEKCPMEKYRNNEEDDDCASVRPWMKFFQKYGTHYTTVIHLGGKVTNQIQLKKTDVASLQKNGYNVDTVIKSNAAIPFLSLGDGSISSTGETSNESKKNSINHEKLVIVIGGDVPTDGTDKVSMKEWTMSLYKKPMPIKVNLESIKTLITEEKKKSIFDSAIKYYSEIYGISPDEMYKTEGRERGVASLAMNGQAVVYEGKTGGSAVCPQNKVIMMGFALSVTRKSKTIFSDVKYTTSIAPCPVGKEKCVASVPSGEADVRIWILCGEEQIPLLIQETKISDNGPASASCPNDYSIAFGFGMSIPKGLQATPADGYACRAGQRTCTHASDKPGRNAVWIACVEKNAPELSDITNYAYAAATPACNKNKKMDTYKDNMCPQNTTLIAGWQMLISENKKERGTKMETCPAASNGCKLDQLFRTQQSTCKAQFSWVSCYNPPELFAKRS